MMKDYKTARAYMDKVQKKYSELGAQDSETRSYNRQNTRSGIR